ncbi:MAG: UDP-N-acetylmuramoyl-tripeptide--D-alanyl-D-alanine ligase [Crocinitomicaceae bacterium]
MKIEELYRLFLAADGISTDTRKLKKNTLFFALKGANFNGNEFALEAIKSGCTYAIVDEEQYAQHDKCILVKNVLTTLQKLANHHRMQFNIPVLAITGSNGKTTTKELIGSVLKKKYNLLMTEGNLNNHLGVPFTLLKLTKEHDFAVIEMGANKPGDIHELAEIAAPNYGLITNIGAAHLEGFGSFEGVLNTKTELYRYLEEQGGMIFINQDDAVLKGKLPDVETYTYGEHSADIIGEMGELNPFVSFRWRSKQVTSDLIETKLIGKYNFTNFLAAVAVGHYFKVAKSDIAEALSDYTPSNNRSQIQKTDRNTLIVDCYNANVTSMKAAIESLVETNHDQKLAILGDMLELGKYSKDEHQNIVDFLNKNELEAVLVGKEFGKTVSSFPVYSDYKAVIEQAGLEKLSNALVLIKGSRGIRLENLIEVL